MLFLTFFVYDRRNEECGYGDKMTTTQSQKYRSAKKFSSEIFRIANAILENVHNFKQSHLKGHLSWMTFKVRYKLCHLKKGGII